NLALEPETSLNGIVSAEVDCETMLRDIDFVLRSLADESRRTRYRREDAIVQRRWLSRCAHEWLKVRLNRLANSEGALDTFHVKLDGGTFHCQDLAYQFGHVCNGTSGFSAPDFQHGILLLLVGSIVDIQNGFPVSLQDISRYMHHCDDRSSRNID